MQKKQTNYILLLISLIIVGTIGIQLYWNYENFKTNELLIFNEVQNSFEDALENYYKNLTKNKSVSVFDVKGDSESSLDRISELMNITKGIKVKDSTSIEIQGLLKNQNLVDSLGFMVIVGQPTREQKEVLKQYKNTISVTVNNDSTELDVLAKSLDSLLRRKKIKTEFSIEQYKKDSLLASYGILSDHKNILKVVSKLAIIPAGESIHLRFKNPIRSIFNRGLIGILASLFLALGIIFSLFYLLRVINKQKQLSEIKNDLISNITHEFKTPIATVLAAIEGITVFKGKNDEEKTNKYLQISKDQLHRLNTMVEKLLETAAINSESIELKKTNADILPLLEKCVTLAKNNYPQKNFSFSTTLDSAVYSIDEFHFENAINNLLDNAAKYGGQKVTISMQKIDSPTKKDI